MLRLERVQYPHNLFKILLYGRFIYYLSFVYLFNNFYINNGFILKNKMDTLNYYSMFCDIFCCLSSSSRHWKLFWLTQVTLTNPHDLGCVNCLLLRIFLWHCRMLQGHLVYFLLQL